VPDGNASILLASATSITRLCAEGGLRPSFFAVFDSTSVLDTADAGDGGSLDDLLRSRMLVACDRSLLSLIDDALPDADRRSRYRANFIAKLARRRVLLLAVLGEEREGNEDQLASCRRDSIIVTEANPHCRCEVVVVVAGDTTPTVRAAIEGLRDEPSIGRIYLMTKWLQSGRDARRIALARHVWPLCVARLLVARAVACESPSTGSQASIMAWRTFAWGTLNTSTSLLVWEAAYLHSLRDQLMPSLDVTPDDRVEDASEVEAGDAAAAVPRDLPSMEWTDKADAIQAAGSAATDASCLDAITAETFRNAAATAFNASDRREKLWSRIRASWARVAAEGGLLYLRRIRDGRFHRPHALASLSQNQRDRWQRMNEDRRSLSRCRVNHERALGALTLARRRYLPLSWRFLIATMILPFVFQFLTGILLPLRSSESDDGSPLFSFPRKATGSVAFLVDRSSSMEGVRLDRMKADLKEAIDRLRDGTPFTVVAFNDDREEFPLASGRLIDATKDTRTAANDWVDGIAARGSTTAVPGLRSLVGRQPDSLVFLTDGQFTEAERAEIAGMIADKAFLGKTRIDTVMLYPVGEESALEDLAKQTGGKYRRVGFDPFAPLGFNRVLFITFCATLAGVALGAWLPWWIERMSGISGTKTLAAHLKKLLADYGRFGRSAAVALSEADEFDTARRSNNAWAYQRSLAARAIGQIEASLTDPALLHEQPATPLRGSVPMEVLAAEDWRDVHDSLDEPLPDLRDMANHHERIQDIAAGHAAELAGLWQKFVSKHDPLSHGHLPLDAIAGGFGDAIGQCLMRASMQLLMPQRRETAADYSARRPFYQLFGRLADRISDDAHRPFLSSRVVAPSGKMPAPSLTWIGVTSYDSIGDIGETAKEYFRQHTQIRFVEDVAVPDVGLRALGLIHEELEVVLGPRLDDTPIAGDA
jgi:hypothetical protein